MKRNGRWSGNNDSENRRSVSSMDIKGSRMKGRWIIGCWMDFKTIGYRVYECMILPGKLGVGEWP